MPNDPISAVASWIGADTVDEGRTGKMPRPPAALPITRAPVQPGEPFGPCLLLLPHGEANFPDYAPWEVGAWDGENLVCAR